MKKARAEWCTVCSLCFTTLSSSYFHYSLCSLLSSSSTVAFFFFFSTRSAEKRFFIIFLSYENPEFFLAPASQSVSCLYWPYLLPLDLAALSHRQEANIRSQCRGQWTSPADNGHNCIKRYIFIFPSLHLHYFSILRIFMKSDGRKKANFFRSTMAPWWSILWDWITSMSEKEILPEQKHEERTLVSRKSSTLQ